MTGDDLRAMGACQAALDWLGDRTVEEAWLVCRRWDWMLWLLRTMVTYGYLTDAAVVARVGETQRRCWLFPNADSIRLEFPTLPEDPA